MMLLEQLALYLVVGAPGSFLAKKTQQCSTFTVQPLPSNTHQISSQLNSDPDKGDKAPNTVEGQAEDKTTVALMNDGVGS